jgi:hypothetical protein
VEIFYTREAYAEPDVPDAAADYNYTSDPTGARARARDQAIAARARKMRELVSQAKALFAQIMAHISPESEAAIERKYRAEQREIWERENAARLAIIELNAARRTQREARDARSVQELAAGQVPVPIPTPDPLADSEVPPEAPNPSSLAAGSMSLWIKFQRQADPVALIQLLYKTHYLVAHGDVTQQRHLARRHYDSLTMDAKESISAFRDRTMSALANMQSANIPLPPEADVTFQFFKRLNGSFASFQKGMEQQVTANLRKWPTTLDQMFEEAYINSPEYKAITSGKASTPKDAGSTSNQHPATTSQDPPHAAFAAMTTCPPATTPPKARNNRKPKGGAHGNSAQAPAPANAGAGTGTGTGTTNPASVKSECALCNSAKIFGPEAKHAFKDCFLRAKTKQLMKGAAWVLYDVQAGNNIWIVALDSGSSCHFSSNTQLVTNLVPNDDGATVGGIMGTEFIPPSRGIFSVFGTAFVAPDANANLLSMGQLETDGARIRHYRNAKVVSFRGHQFRFKKINNLFLCDLSKHPLFEHLAASNHDEPAAPAAHAASPGARADHHSDQVTLVAATTSPRPASEVSLLTSVETQESKHTARQVSGAKEAQQVLERLAYPNVKTMTEAINTGVFINMPVTAQDVTRSVQIYGSTPTLKGKMKRPPTTNMDDFDHVTVNDHYKVSQTLHVDTMMVLRESFLISLSLPLGLISIEPLADRSTHCITEALRRTVKMLKHNGFFVTHLRADNELAITNAAIELDLQVDTVSPGSHNPLIEVQIGHIKGKVRSVLANTARFYDVPRCLIPHLLKFVVSRSNMFPTHSEYVLDPKIPAREKLLGRKTDYQRDVRFEFGEYVQAYDVNNPTPNSMAPHSIDALLLFPANDRSGCAWCLNLTTKHLFKTNRWTPQPISDSVRQAIKALGRVVQPDDNDFDDAAEDEDPAPPIAGVYAHAGITGVPQPPATIHQSERPLTRTVTFADPPATAEQVDTAVDITVEPTTPATAPAEPVTTLASARTLRDRSTLQPPERFRESLFHLSIGKSVKEFGEQATKDSMKIEIKNLLNYDSVEPVHWHTLTQHEKDSVIRSSLFLKDKRDNDGKLTKLKSRLVAGGDQQDKSLYSKADTSAPTVSTTSLLTTLAIAASEDRKITVVDIGSAYLNAKMEGPPVYMSIEPQLTMLFVELSPDMAPYVSKDKLVVRLKKGLYGCVQSALLWYRNISSTLADFGYTPNPVDPCVFNKTVDGFQVTVDVHVDDAIITTAHPTEDKTLTEQLRAKYGTITVHEGKEHVYLGMHIIKSGDGTIQLDMKKYLKEIVEDTHTTATANTPAATALFEVPEAPPLSHKEAEAFRSMVARLLYAGTHVRPDLMLALAFLTSRAQAPTESDQAKLTRLLQYVNGTLDLTLKINAGNVGTITAYVDSSYGVHPDGKGHTGGVITLGTGAIHVRSTKQKLVAKSSTESELIGLYDYSSHIIHLREFLSGQGYQVGPALVKHDNKSTIAMLARGKHSGERTKHIAMRYFFLKDRSDSLELKMEYWPTEDMLADQLTKPLQGKQFTYLRNLLLGQN